MAESAKVKFSDIIDLAVGGQQIDPVKMSLLHTVLHTLTAQMGLAQCKMSFEGEAASALLSLKEKSPLHPSKFLNYSVLETADRDLMAGTDAKSAPVRQLEFHTLENKVRMLASHVEALTMLPATETIMEQIRAQPQTAPVSEMLHTVALTKRVSGVEEEVAKIASLFERLCRDHNILRNIFQKEFPHINFEAPEFDIASAGKELTANVNSEAVDRLFESQIKLKEQVDRIQLDLDAYLSQLHSSQLSQTENIDVPTAPEGRSSKSSVSSYKSVTNKKISYEKRIGALESDLANFLNKFKSLEQTNKIEFCAINEQLKVIETEILNLKNKVKDDDDVDFENDEFDAGFGKMLGADNMVLDEMAATITTLNEELEDVSNTLQTVITDLDKKNDIIKKIRSQIESVEESKLDKSYLEELLAAKADTTLVNRKVSYEQFDFTCNQLNVMVNDALQKLNEQENNFAMSMEELNNTIKNKMDRLEIAPLKEFINYRLKVLQEKLKSMVSQKMDNEAAGTKKQLLRDIQCISCNRPALQKSEKACAVRTDEFPITRTVKPFLSYELDQIRRQRKQMPETKNINELIKVISKNQKFKDSHDHLCNRYCGGSHTLTTPQQRVSREGHEVDQIGVDVVPFDKETCEVVEQDEPTTKVDPPKKPSGLGSITSKSSQLKPTRLSVKTVEPVSPKALGQVKFSQPKIVKEVSPKADVPLEEPRELTEEDFDEEGSYTTQLQNSFGLPEEDPYVLEEVTVLPALEEESYHELKVVSGGSLKGSTSRGRKSVRSSRALSKQRSSKHKNALLKEVEPQVIPFEESKEVVPELIEEVESEYDEY